MYINYESEITMTVNSVADVPNSVAEKGREAVKDWIRADSIEETKRDGDITDHNIEILDNI